MPTTSRSRLGTLPKSAAYGVEPCTLSKQLSANTDSSKSSTCVTLTPCPRACPRTRWYWVRRSSLRRLMTYACAPLGFGRNATCHLSAHIAP
eukprot:1453959-Prorocentrum_lima.AAC.1